jgi:hypothetical protein
MQYRYLQARGAVKESAGPSPLAGDRLGQSVPPALYELLPESFAREHLVFPVAVEGETVTVAAVDPGQIALADKLSFLIARKVKFVRFPREEILALINLNYGRLRRESQSVESLLQDYSETDRASRTFGLEPAAQVQNSTARRQPVPLGRTRFSGRSGESLRTLEESGALGASASIDSIDLSSYQGDSGVFTYVVEEGQRVLMLRPNGTMEVLVGPKRVWRGWNTFHPMVHHVAHPGDYLIIRYRDGRQEHLPGPTEAWFDPRIHREITREEALQVAAKEAVVVYSSKEGTNQVQRRIEYGPTLFIPRPGEWLHTFSWHSSEGGSQGARKVPRGLVFQKLWLMPDQMYHDVPDVRTADDAVLTIRLMIFFELTDITRMLDTTHDPIGDFVNATTSDVVDFIGRHDFESFKRNTDKLNELETYRQLTVRASQCGYRIDKVVYRGYGAPERLQQMHDQAIEARTRLQLDRATEQQAQDLENFRLDCQLQRAGKRRHEQGAEVEHELELARKKQEAELRDRETRHSFLREQKRMEAELAQCIRTDQDVQRREHLTALRDLGVDLTSYLTQSRADRVIELRGPRGATHVHLDTAGEANGERTSP